MVQKEMVFWGWGVQLPSSIAREHMKLRVIMSETIFLQKYYLKSRRRGSRALRESGVRFWALINQKQTIYGTQIAVIFPGESIWNRAWSDRTQYNGDSGSDHGLGQGTMGNYRDR